MFIWEYSSIKKKKKKSTFLPTLKILGRVTANKHFFKDGLKIHAVRFQTLYQVEKLKANSMDPDQTARMHRLVWIHAGRKRISLVLS
jgi:hypothetical protein